MLKQFLKHSSIYIASSFLTRGLGFILLPILTRYLAPSDYGVIDLINITGLGVLIFFGIESYQGIARFIGSYDEIGKQALFSSVIIFLSISYAIFFVFAILFKNIICAFFYSGIPIGLYILIIFSYFFQALINQSQTTLSYDINPKKSIIITFCVALFLIFFNCIFVIFLKLGLNGAILAIFSSNLLGACVAYLCTKKYFSYKEANFEIVKKVLKFSFPLAISAFFTLMLLYIDRVSIKFFLGVNSVGIFSVAYRLASIISIVMVGIQGALGPLIYRNVNDPNSIKQLALLFEKFMVIASCFILSLELFAPELIIIFTSEAYHYASSVVRILVPAVIISYMYIFFPGMNINKKTNVIMKINIISAIINLFLNIILIHYFKIAGSATATLISYSIFLGLFIYNSQKIYYIPIRTKLIIRQLMTCLILSLFGLLLNNSLSVINVVIKCIVLVIFLSFCFTSKPNLGYKTCN